MRSSAVCWRRAASQVEIGVPPLGEILMKPWTSHYRNLSSIVTEEMLRAHPIDCAVLMGGCDKSIPAHLMGGISLDIPIIIFPAGPMKRGTWRGKDVASGTTAWQAIADCGAGVRPMSDLTDLEHHEGTSTGTCMSMNTGTTMQLLTEVLGFSLSRCGSHTSGGSTARACRSANGSAGRRTRVAKLQTIGLSDAKVF
jgi:dihydroxyacid dehydratase/phosphogluconate dehydratase